MSSNSAHVKIKLKGQLYILKFSLTWLVYKYG